MVVVALLGFIKQHKKLLLFLALLVLVFVAISLAISLKSTKTSIIKTDPTKHIITLFDGDKKQVFLTHANTVGQALKDYGIEIDQHDLVEPSTDSQLIASNYWVNIYRARPVTVIDGATKVKTITPYQTPRQIAKDVGMTLRLEDGATLSRSDDILGAGAGVVLTIKRSVPIKLDLYGSVNEIRTLSSTVGDMLSEKGVELTKEDKLSLDINSQITAGMYVKVWREGKQIVAVNEPIQFSVEQIQDADRLVNYHAIKTEGRIGSKQVSYEIVVKDGVEVSRIQIAQIIITQPQKQVEIIGIKSFPGALTKSTGAQYFTDKKGISHRETYYDLDMSRVMQQCGQKGYYTVRIDGVKVDRDGYVIIAANLDNYPRCSVVDTSVGPAKVYDTGGFALRHPFGFDIATDWSNMDGR